MRLALPAITFAGPKSLTFENISQRFFVLRGCKALYVRLSSLTPRVRLETLTYEAACSGPAKQLRSLLARISHLLSQRLCRIRNQGVPGVPGSPEIKFSPEYAKTTAN
jgi:hypothetical protein